jgi:hypothetical protein
MQWLGFQLAVSELGLVTQQRQDFSILPQRPDVIQWVPAVCSLRGQTATKVPHAVSKNLCNNSVALVRKQSIPTERPSLVGEVSANFCG